MFGVLESWRISCSVASFLLMTSRTRSSLVLPRSGTLTEHMQCVVVSLHLLSAAVHICVQVLVTACRHSILTSKLSFNRSCWTGISDDAKDFVGSLLNRDPAARPTAKQALQHPWLKGEVGERSQGQPLQRSVVQRIQVITMTTKQKYA